MIQNLQAKGIEQCSFVNYTFYRLAYDDLKKIINSIFIKDIKFLLRDEFVE